MEMDAKKIIDEIHKKTRDIANTIIAKQTDENLLEIAKADYGAQYCHASAYALKELGKRKPNLYHLYKSLNTAMSETTFLNLYKNIKDDVALDIDSII